MPAADLPSLIVSPAEPAWLKLALANHFSIVTSNKLTEARGVDMAWLGGQVRNADAGQWWGVQRKEVGDLLASMNDGRLAREVAMMAASGGVQFPHVIVEGKVGFTNNGVMVRQFGADVTVRQWRGLLWSLQSAGVGVTFSRNGGETVELVVDLHTWSTKARHTTLVKRPGAPAGEWGTRASTDWARHFLQGFDGIGPETADAIIRRFGVPLQWTVTEAELMTVEGIGKTRAATLSRALAKVDI